MNKKEKRIMQAHREVAEAQASMTNAKTNQAYVKALRAYHIIALQKLTKEELKK